MAIGRRPPTVTIGYFTIPESWDRSSVAAVDELQIVWGRGGQYDRNEPVTLALDVIDPTGSWAAETVLIGAPVRVVLDTGRLLFRGRVAGLTMERVIVDDEPAWIAHVEASDIFGDLARDLAYNQVPYGTASTSPADPGGWSIGPRSAFADHLLVGGAKQYVDSIETPAGIPTLAQPIIEVSERKTWADIISGWYLTIPFAVPNYDPVTNGIVIGLPAPSRAAIELRWITPQLELIPDSTVPSTVAIPASSMEYDLLELTSTIADAITGVQLNFSNRVNSSAGNATEKPGSLAKAVPGTTERGARVLQVDLIAEGGVQDAGSTTVTYPPPGSGIQLTLENWAAAIAVLNDKMKIPPLRYMLNDHPPASFDDLLLSTFSQALTVYFSGSELAGIPNVPTAFQIIGGELHWVSGWAITVNAVPAPGPSTLEIVTIAALVSNATPTFADYSPEITIGDLGTVTKGAA